MFHSCRPTYRILIILSIASLSFFLTLFAEAASYYVSTTGTDSNPGTFTSPWRTIQHSLDVAVKGDTIFVRGGKYKESPTFGFSGDEGSPITLRNYPGELPVILPGSAPGQQVLLQAASGYENPIGWIVIQGFEISGAYVGIKFYNAHDIIIQSNHIHHAVTQGILGPSGIRITIDSNLIHDNGTLDITSNKYHGIYATGSFYVITNNIIRNNTAYGIQVAGYPYDSSWMAGAEYGGASGWFICNNVVANEKMRSGIVVWQPDATAGIIQNNIFYKNSLNAEGANGVNFFESGAGHLVLNNTYYTTQNRPPIIDTAGGASYTESGAILTDPRFVKPKVHNYHLRANSPAIDSGYSTQSPDHDFDGVSRPQGVGYDIGAYEYVF